MFLFCGWLTLLSLLFTADRHLRWKYFTLIVGQRNSVRRPPQDPPHLKHAQRLLHVLLLREELDSHSLEGGDDRGSRKPLLLLVVERSQPLGQFLLRLLGLNEAKARQAKASQGKARRAKARQGKARQGETRQGRASQGKASQGVTLLLQAARSTSLGVLSSTPCHSFFTFNGTNIKNLLYHHTQKHQVQRKLLQAITLFGKDFRSWDMMRTARASPRLLPVIRSPRNLIAYAKARTRKDGKPSRADSASRRVRFGDECASVFERTQIPHAQARDLITPTILFFPANSSEVRGSRPKQTPTKWHSPLTGA